MRVTIDLMKKSTQIIDLSNVINPRVGDDDLLLPLHIIYGDNQTDMRGKDVEFLSNDPNKKNIYIAGTCNTNTPGDNLYTGDLTFRFPAGTFQADGTYDPDKTMFRIVDKETQKVISSVNVKITVMKNNIEFDFDPDKSSYDSRAETMLNDFKDKGQAMLDEINDLNNQAKSNVSGDTAATANAAKQQANANAGDISDLKGEVAGARGRFADLPGREDAQDTAISQKETIVNANANYAALQQKDAQQDTAISQKETIVNANANYAALQQKDAQQDAALNQKAGKFELEEKLSQMDLQPEGFENEAALNAKYPNGKSGIMVTVDTGHKWIWIDGAWKDCGVFQSVGTGYIADVGTITPDGTSGLSLGNADGARKDSMYSLLGTSKNVINLPDGVSNASTNLLFTYGDKYPVQLFLSQNKIWKRETSNGNYTAWSLIVDMNANLSLIGNLTNVDDMKSNSFYIGISATDSVQGLPRLTAQKHEYLIETYGKVESLSAVQRFTSPEENAIWIRHRAVADGKLYWTEWQPLFNLVIHVNSSGAWNSFGRLVDAVDYANKIASERFPITVKVEKDIDLYQELGGADFISSISNGNRNGLTLKPYVNLDGSNGVTITCEVPDDVATANSIPNMSGLEVYGANKITGINLRVKNVRYGIHDETGNNSSFNDMYHIYENCKVYHGGNKDNIWTPSGAICCGTSNGFNFEIKNCVLESKDYVGFTLHNNDNQTRGKLVIDGLKLTGGFDYDGAGQRSMKIAYYQNAKKGSCQVIFKNIKADNPIVVRKESNSVPSTNAYEIVNFSNIDVDIR